MAAFFNLLTHAVIVAGLLGVTLLVGIAIRSTAELSEKAVLVTAALTGFLIYFGSRAIGMSIPGLLLPAISDPNPYKVGLIGMLCPVGAGVLVAWHGLRSLRNQSAISRRLLLLGATFTVALFGDVYASTFEVVFVKNGVNASLLPNLAFQIGMALHLIFHYQPGNKFGTPAYDKHVQTRVGIKRFRSSSFDTGPKIAMGN